MKKIGKITAGMLFGICLAVVLPAVGVYAAAPSGYMTDGNEIMAYRKNGSTVDIKSYYNDDWIQTTYNNVGYEIISEDLTGADITVNPTIFNAGHYVNLAYTVTNSTENDITDGKLAVYADTMIGDNDDATIEVIKNAQGRVIGVKMVDTHASCSSKDAQFNLYFAGTGGVTDVSTYWFGHYDSRKSNAFRQIDSNSAGNNSSCYTIDEDGNYTAFSREDSGIALSWQNINLASGESKTFSCILGVGTAADPPQWSDGEGENAPVRLSMTAEATKSNLIINVAAKVKDAAGVTDHLFYNVNGDVETQLGSVEADGENTKDIEGTIDMTGWKDGTYVFQFWVVNSKGVTSEAVERTVTLTNGTVTGDIILPAETEHKWASAWSGNATHHWHECENVYCTITNNVQKNGYGEHIFEYQADDTTDVIAETCTTEGCPYHETATLKLNAEVSAVYTGNAVEAAEIAYSGGWKGGTLSIVYSDNVNAGTASASCTIGGKTVSVNFTIDKAAQSAPTLSAKNETIKGKADGQVTGLTTGMEYRKAGETDYISVTDENMTFAAGTYEVRYAESENYNASDAVSVTIGEGRMLTVTFTAEGMSDIVKEVAWNGSLTNIPNIPEKEGYTQTAPVWSITDFTGITEDKTVYAVYTINQYSVILPERTTGYAVVADENDNQVEHGGNYTFRFELAAGYSRTDEFAVKVNGSPVTLSDAGEYTITGIREEQTVTVEGVADITAPTAKIEINENAWTNFLHTITFNLFFKDTQDVTITAEDVDTGSGIDKISYYLSDTPLTETKVKELTEWTEYTGVFKINPKRKYVIYAKVTDNAGNAAYISSDGIVLGDMIQESGGSDAATVIATVAVKTGDHSCLALWSILIAVSGIMIVGITAVGRQKKTRVK